ncbi:MAG: glycoside hydrolase family 28 protein [Bacteroidales bacterium]|nr:glycoside hydrolase family 28 protein [Bacteroidales bacterium]
MKRIVFTSILAGFCLVGWARDFNILDFGARFSETVSSTQAIQQAIDRCSASGGGRVVVPSGIFRTGTLILRDDVELHLCRDAVLQGSDCLEDYPFLDVRFQTRFTDKSYYTGRQEILRYRALLFAESVSNVSLSGYGQIDGNGGADVFQLGNDAGSRASLERPVLILMVDCREVQLNQVQLRNSAYWMQCYLACDGVTLNGVKVSNHCNFNNDGIDIDSKNVIVENCEFDSDDDAICLKSHDPDRWCENVVIRNCTVRTNCNGIKLGTGSLGGFRNIRIENILFRAASADRIRLWQRIVDHVEIPNTMLSGLAIENVDGGISENIEAENLHMENVQTPVFIKLGNRMPRAISDAPAALRNIRISNVRATSYSRMCSSITGWPGHPVENVTLMNILISTTGGTPASESPEEVPECEEDYPENRMFGFTLPASSLWARHVKRLVVENAQFVVRNPDGRPEVVLQDVSDATLSCLRNGKGEEAVTKIQ